jgi:hypothetical protein
MFFSCHPKFTKAKKEGSSVEKNSLVYKRVILFSILQTINLSFLVINSFGFNVNHFPT